MKPLFPITIVSIIFFLALCPIAYAQKTPMSFERFSVEEGLPQASGYSLAQDADGFIWMGTQDGLCRYDGYQFQIHRMQTDSGLMGNTMNSILCDRQGRLWAGTPDGLSFKDRNQAHFSPFEPLMTNNIHMLFEDKQAYIWVLTFDTGLFCISPDRKTVKNYFLDTPFRTRMIDITQTPDGQLWVAARTALLKYNIDNQSFTTYTIEHILGKTEREMTVRALEADGEGNLWIGGFDNGVFVTDPKQFSDPSVKSPIFAPSAVLKTHISSKNTPKILAGNSITELCAAKNGDMWIGTKDGLTIFRRANNRLDTYHHRDDDPLSIPRNYFISFLEDRQGLFWIGTSGGGVAKYDPIRQRFTHLRQLTTEANPKVDNLTYAIQQTADGTLYFGVQSNGLVRLKNGQYTVFRSDDNKPDALLNNSIYGIEDGGNQRDLWLATLGGLAKFDTKTEKITPFHFSKDGSEVKVSAICKLRGQNVLLVSSLKGLVQLDLTSHRWLSWRKGNGKLSFSNASKVHQTNATIKNTEGSLWLKDITVRRIFEDADGTIWFGTESKGLIRLDRQTNELRQFMALPSTTVRAVIDAQKGQLWVGTDHGLVLFDKQNETVLKTYKITEGLPNELIYSLLKDNEGNLWITTNNGMARLSPDEKTIRTFDVNDGLQSNEFNTNGAYKAPDGRLFFGGVNGVTAFYNQNFSTNSYNAPIRITGFKVFNKDFTLDNTQNVALSYEQNFFSIEFAALNYSFTYKNKYAYQLEGVDADWVYCGTQHSANYTDVKAGHYIFKVRGANNDGVWSTETAVLHLYIRPVFWQTAWFKGLIALILATLIYLLTNFYNKTRYQLRLSALERETEKERLRTSIAQDIHDEVGAGLTKIALAAQLAARLSNSDINFKEKLINLGEDARLLAHQMREIVFAINPDYDSFFEMQAYFKETSTAFWSETAMELFFDFEKNRYNPTVRPDIKRQLLLIFKEAQNNIAKHANATQVHLTFKMDTSTHYVLAVQDNGNGIRPLSTNGFSKGLSGMKRRAESIGASFIIVFKENEGTTVKVKGVC